ncbi:MAG TPA: hypothetical protein VFY39_08530 [Gammaproteobacteria bacterium]|nr:hypothetical protein [Gammaproteobacteria bacterium]
MSERRAEVSRLLIALGPQSETALELASYLRVVGGEQAELLGLLVEDPRVAAHAGSRLAREIVLSGLERRLEPAGLERQLRARAAQLRRRFEAAAAKLGSRHDFQVVRGELLTEVLRAAERADALIVDAAGAPFAPSAWSLPDLQRLLRAARRFLLIVREGWFSGREVLVVLTCEAEVRHAFAPVLATALQIARETRSPLAVVLVCSAAPRTDRLARELGHAASLAGVPFEGVLTAPGLAVGERVTAVRRRHPRLVLLAGESAEEETLVEALLPRISSSLLWLKDA